MSLPLLSQVSESKGLLFQLALIEAVSLGHQCKELIQSLQNKPLPTASFVVKSLEGLLGQSEKELSPLFLRDRDESGFSLLTQLFQKLGVVSKDKELFQRLSDIGKKTMRHLLELLLALRFSSASFPKKIYNGVIKVSGLLASIVKGLWQSLPEFVHDEKVLWHIYKHRERLMTLFGARLIDFLNQSHSRGVKRFLLERFKKKGFDHIVQEIERESPLS